MEYLQRHLCDRCIASAYHKSTETAPPRSGAGRRGDGVHGGGGGAAGGGHPERDVPEPADELHPAAGVRPQQGHEEALHARQRQHGRAPKGQGLHLYLLDTFRIFHIFLVFPFFLFLHFKIIFEFFLFIVVFCCEPLFF